MQMIVADGDYVETTTYTYQIVQVPWDFFTPQPDELPYLDMFVIPQSMALGKSESTEPAPTEPVDAVYDTGNIVCITFYAYFGGGKGSDVPAENMAEIINWLNSFTIGERAPEILPPGTGTVQVEIEYTDGTIIKRSLDTITVNGVIYYLNSDPMPEILEEILAKIST